MKKWSRQIVLTVLSAILCAVTPSSAKAMGYGGDCNSCDPYGCYDSCSVGGFAIGGELVYWKPCLDHMEYAVVEDNSDEDVVKTRYKTLCPDWELGGRIWAYAPSLFCGSCGLGVSWTGICGKDSTSVSTVDVSGTEVFAPVLITGDSYDKVSVHWKNSYNDYDVLFSYSCCCGDSSVFRPFFGFAGLVMNQKVRTKGIVFEESEEIFVVESKWKSDLSAYGLRVGTEYECKLADCLSLFGKFSASVVTGKPKTKNPQTVDDSTETEIAETTIREDECYRAYPGFHLSTGLIYNTCLCDMDFSAKIGYEFIEWHNLPHQRQLIQGNPTDGTGSSDHTFGWQGLTAGVSVRF